MRRSDDGPKFATEADMCDQLIDYAGARGWVCYPETAGHDLLLVRKTDGYQIGIQAKLQANLEVLSQSVRGDGFWVSDGPDFRAVLVPYYCAKVSMLQEFCPYIGTTLITARPGKVDRQGSVRMPNGYGWTSAFRPGLPGEPGWDAGSGREWFELCPSRRCRLPEYVPDVRAGVPAPVQLTHWKIGAIKIAVLLERRGHVRREDFKHLHIDHRRWIASGPNSILIADPPHGFRQRDGGKPGMGFKAEHPRNYDEIAADFEKWAPRNGVL